ncbi:DUF3616 domain-containing protein [Hymenobacter taeanensis]|uniref:DUF3616 domain-containing protein n=1 Tax=Hymenobacter taeanensis TaxID=2735321 RepID=A0A6M6BEM2_9BACT|nr:MULTISPECIES: DUF3616 domain-containing protein [Hymenobacter]QJX46392.1 DUF3616 domain-containing protein [Hymenobacter taeanensis]UOQ80253.1 DUF3616 domain-containing protein [Hymenobacter sp. 5414T-23]
MPARTYILHFDPKLSQNPNGNDVRDGLSAAVLTGDNLWLCCDERTTLERLRRTGPRSFGQHCSYKLSELVDLPEKATEEIDLEGMGEAENYLWVLGSHSIKRKNAKPEEPTVAKQIKRLAKIVVAPNRCLLARIPLVRNPKSGDYELCKTAKHPTASGQTLRAAQLRGDKNGTNELLKVLAKDAHLGPALKVPAKDNGLDIEGLAASPDGRLFLGLRGPVLHGWAIVLEIRPEEYKKGRLRLGELEGGEHKLYKKHFLDLRGMGIREIRQQGTDLFILAGPTMDLDGTIAIYRWRNALFQAHDSLTPADQLERLLDVPHLPHLDRAEGMALLSEQEMLVVFDKPAPARKPRPHTALANTYPLPTGPSVA